MKKLNSKGFSHEILIVGIVALTAIAGVGFMVSSNANSATSGDNISTTTAIKKPDLKCKITNLQKKPKFGAQLNPKVKITNTSKTKTITTTPYASLYLSGLNNSGTTSSLKSTFKAITLKPRKSKTVLIPIKPYPVIYQTQEAAKGYYAVGSATIADPFIYCTANFVLPSPK